MSLSNVPGGGWAKEFPRISSRRELYCFIYCRGRGQRCSHVSLTIIPPLLPFSVSLVREFDSRVVVVVRATALSNAECGRIPSKSAYLNETELSQGRRGGSHKSSLWCSYAPMWDWPLINFWRELIKVWKLSRPQPRPFVLLSSDRRSLFPFFVGARLGRGYPSACVSYMGWKNLCGKGSDEVFGSDYGKALGLIFSSSFGTEWRMRKGLSNYSKNFNWFNRRWSAKVNIWATGMIFLVLRFFPSLFRTHSKFLEEFFKNSSMDSMRFKVRGIFEEISPKSL